MKPWGLYRISNLCLLVAVAGGMATAGSAAQMDDDLSSELGDGLNTQSIERLLVQADAVLGLGSTGSAVKDLQAMLALMGYYSGAVDGAYEQMTVEAVRQFQVDAGLPADGLVGPLTWSRLLPTPTTLANPPLPSDEPTAEPEADNSPSDAASGSDVVAETAGDWPILKLDDTGDDVIRLQARLADLNVYTGAIDGGFGVQTEEAVKQFQRQAGLEVDGIAGPATWRELFN